MLFLTAESVSVLFPAHSVHLQTIRIHNTLTGRYIDIVESYGYVHGIWID